MLDRINPLRGRLIATAVLAAGFALAATAASAQPATKAANIYFVTIGKILDEIAATPAFVAAIKDQNAKTAGLDEKALLVVDKKWRDGDGTLIKGVMETGFSKRLAEIVAGSEGLISEIIVMDAKGGNVAISSKTTDYWQGDEAKWKKTFGANTRDMFIDRVEFDQSTRTFSQQISQAIVIGVDSIGAITVGFDITYKPKRDAK